MSYAIPYSRCSMKNVILTQQVPGRFIQLADFYGLEPETLSALVLIDFCQHPPKNLVIVESDVSCSGIDSLRTRRAEA